MALPPGSAERLSVGQAIGLVASASQYGEGSTSSVTPPARPSACSCCPLGDRDDAASRRRHSLREEMQARAAVALARSGHGGGARAELPARRLPVQNLAWVPPAVVFCRTIVTGSHRPWGCLYPVAQQIASVRLTVLRQLLELLVEVRPVDLL
jgi:hypothetical protein